MILLQIPFLFIGTTELVLIAAVCLLLFGGKKLPELMRGLGKGMHEFKNGMTIGEEQPEQNNAEENSSSQ